MLTDDGTTPEVETPAVEDPQGSGQETESSGGNPAWEPLREKLDPLTFRQVEPILKGWDNDAQTRITSLNEQLNPWKAFSDAGHTPEKVAQWQALAERLDSEPEVIYQALEEFLTREGRMPTKAEIKAEVEDAEGDGEKPEAPASDPRFDQLAESNKQMLEFLQNQQNEKLQASAEKALDTEIKAFEEAHKDYRPSEIKEVLRRAAFQAQQTGKNVTLEEANTEYAAFRTELLTAPRAGDSAPKLPPLSGGTAPSGEEKKSLGALSRQEMQELGASVFGQK